MSHIVAVVVTHNRLSLLQETITSVKSQTVTPTDIVVINNGSDDGTKEWLDSQQDISVYHQSNMGASGGFYTGINQAIKYNPDWVWVMDDDTICTPNALEILLEKTQAVTEEVGFVGSKCIWLDNSPHLMNIPAIKPSFNSTVPFNKYDGEQLLLIETCSWVSLLINPKAVKEVGLPYKEFFFWSDDCEYTRRITSAGYLGLYCAESIVVHKTPLNYCPDFYRDTVKNLWKHQYGFRNEFFLKKKYKGFLYYMFWLTAKVGYTSFKLLKIRNDNQFRFIRVLLNAAWQSIFFNPKIDRVDQVEPVPLKFEDDTCYSNIGYIQQAQPVERGA